MSVLVKDLEMPGKGYIDVRIFRDGTAVIATGEKPYYRELKAVEVPTPHGDLIDVDKAKEDIDYVCDAGGWLEPVTKAVNEYVKRHLDKAPKVIEAEE